jgi:YVTN family beta-propeller protein
MRNPKKTVCVFLLLTMILTLLAINGVQAVGVISTIALTNPNWVAYDSGKGEIFVIASGRVSIISDNTNTVVATVAVGQTPDCLAYDSGKGEVFVTDNNSSAVYVISDSTNTVVATIPVGEHPEGLAYDSGKGEIFVSSFSSNSVCVISDSTNAIVANITVGEGPLCLAYDSAKGEIFVVNSGSNTIGVVTQATSGSCSVISDSTNTVVATVTVGVVPFAIAYDSGKGEIFVSGLTNPYLVSTIYVISDTTDTVVANLTARTRLGFQTMGIAYDSGKGEIFVTDFNSSTVSVILDSTNIVAATVNVGAEPIGLAYDSGKGEVFVASYKSSTVSVISDSPSSSVSPSPTVPEFSSVAFILLVVATLFFAVIFVRWKSASKHYMLGAGTHQKP